MSDLFLQAQKQPELFLDSPTSTREENNPPSFNSVMAEFYAAQAEGRDTAEIHAELEAGLEPMLKQRAQTDVQQKRDQTALGIVDTVLQNSDNPVAELTELRDSLLFNEFAAPDIVSLMEDGEFDEREKRAFDRLIAAERIIAKKQEQRSHGITSGVGYFLDTAVASPIHNVVGAGTELLGINDGTFEGAGQLIDLAEEARGLLASDIPADVFEEEFGAILDRVADAGFGSDENPFYLNTFIEMVKEGEFGPTATSERLFQVLDITTIGVAGMLRNSTRGAGRLAETPRLMTRLKGRDKATEIVKRYADTGTEGPILAENRPSVVRAAKQDATYFSGPELKAQREVEAANTALKVVRESHWGTFVDPTIVRQKTDEWVSVIRERNQRYYKHELDIEVRVDEFGNLVGRAWLGKQGPGGAGEVYKTQAAAQKLADRVGGTVHETIDAGKKAWIVAREWNIPTEGLSDATDITQVATSWVGQHMSTTTRTDARLDQMLKQGEAQASRVLNVLGKQYRAARSQAPKIGKQNVEAILRELRDDPHHNWRTQALDSGQFRERYFEKFGTLPDEATENYYMAVQEINDVDYYLNADAILKDAVNNNEEMVNLEGVFYRAKKVTVDSTEMVWDTNAGRLRPFNEMGEADVYAVKDYSYAPGGGAGVKYVAGSNFNTRRLYHTDVLAYNTGGHRAYNETVNFFIKQDTSTTLRSGEVVTGTPKAFMAVRTEDEARAAVEQFNTISQAIRDGVSGNQLDDIIRANNDWHGGIEDIADLQRLADEHNLDLEAAIDFAGDGDILQGEQFAGFNTLGDIFRDRWNAKNRGSRPLIGYGGADLDTFDPTQAIERGFASSVNRFADKNYLFNAVNGWLKAAKDANAVKNLDALQGLPPKEAMQRAELRTGIAASDALEAERRTIGYALSQETLQTVKERRVMESAADFVYGKGYKRSAKAMDWVASGDPAGAIRSVAFHTKLGMFNWDQVYIQGSQLINAMGISSATVGPLGAMRGLVAVAPIRIALHDGIPEAARRAMLKSASPFTGLSADEMMNVAEWLKATGRNIVDRTVVEENKGSAFVGFDSNKVVGASQVFFREGEMIARVGAAALNALERKKQFGTLDDMFDPSVTREMLGRQDLLTANMTSASAAPWQRSMVAVPLQFQTYTMRMFEQMFGSVLTPAEKRNLIATHLFLYGAAAAPAAGWALDKYRWNNPHDDTQLYDVLRYGAMDTALTMLVGEETALSSRIGLGEGLWDFFTSVRDDGIPEVLVGPGGGIILDGYQATSKLLTNLFTGDFNHLEYDWNRLARIATSYNRGYNFWVAQKYGVYLSRKQESQVLTDLNDVDAFLLGAGIPLREQQELWGTLEIMQNEDKHLESHFKEMQRLANIIDRELQDGNRDEALAFIDDLGAMMAILDGPQKQKALRRLRLNSPLPETIVRQTITRGKPDIAFRLQELSE